LVNKFKPINFIKMTTRLERILEELTELQVRFVQARLTTTSDAEAARKAGTTPGTFYNWKNKDKIRKAIQLSRLEFLEQARNRLKQAAVEAVEVVLDEMRNPRGSSNRLTAALQILDRIGLPRGVDITSGGESFVLSREERLDAMDKLADVLRSTVLGKPDGGWDVVDAEEQTTMVSLTEPS
jgi:hypothetical protein